jgi:hypothetical protein
MALHGTYSLLVERTKGGACGQEFPLNRVGRGADGRKARAYVVTIIIITACARYLALYAAPACSINL